MISEITFGFWPKLFGRRYNALWWERPRPLLSDVIPNHPRVSRDTRSRFETRLEYFAVLRNRMMHQEAIFEGVAALNRPLLPISDVHAQLVETIAWIDEGAARMADCLDRFEAVHNPVDLEALDELVRLRFTT